jgi:hypothetical protein
MTTKVSQIAMFAIAAFALGGMMVAPAFAATETASLAVAAPSSGIRSDSETDANECGYGEGIYSFVTVSNGVEDYIKVTADAEDCNSHTNTSIVVKKNGSQIYSGSTSNDYKVWWFQGSINTNDAITVSFTYTYI